MDYPRRNFLLSYAFIWCSMFIVSFVASDCPFTLNIKEHPANLQIVGNLQEHLGLEGEATYSLTNPLFDINPNSGVIFTKNVDIDREILCSRGEVVCSEQMVVMIKFTDKPPELCDVIVNIEDINDNAPEFDDNSYTYEIYENDPQATVDLMLATDADSGVNGIADCKSSGELNDIFTISMNADMECQLKLMQALDREETARYETTLIVIDGASPAKSSSVQLIINVMDVNDNYPVFSEDTYETSIIENNAIGVPILTLSATDADADRMGLVKFRIHKREPDYIKDTFSVDEYGSVLARQQLDRETDSEIRFKVTAFDQGVPPKEATATVIVRVVDDNDNEPKVEINVFGLETVGDTIYISEDFKEGSFIGVISMSDDDIEENADIGYEFTGGRGDIIAVESSGNINQLIVKSANNLDYEKIPIYYLTLTVWDKPFVGTSHQVKKKYTVRVKDVNDCYPTFPEDVYTVDIMENNDPNTGIINVKATDADSDDFGHVGYSLESSLDGLFSINQNGRIKALRSLDREAPGLQLSGGQLNLTVWAQDRGRPPKRGNTTVVVNIIDVNDNTPAFSLERFDFFIDENRIANTFIGQLRATDRDFGVNGLLTFSIVSSSNEINNKFVVEKSTGKIYSRVSLNHEERELYSFVVKARDSGFPFNEVDAFCNVRVNDVNDNAPTILKPQNNQLYAVPLDSQKGRLIVKVIATDLDSGNNGSLNYAIIDGNRRNIFAVSTVGDVFVRQTQMDRAFMDLYEVVVEVSDKGTPVPLTSRVRLRIDVKDEKVSGEVIILNTTFIDYDSGSTPDGGASSGSSTFIVAVSVLGGVVSFILLILLVLVVYFRCHDRCARRKRGGYRGPPGPDDLQVSYDNKGDASPSLALRHNALPPGGEVGTGSGKRRKGSAGRRCSEVGPNSSPTHKSYPKPLPPGCNDECRTLGHSDQCWMLPQVVKDSRPAEVDGNYMVAAKLASRGSVEFTRESLGRRNNRPLSPPPYSEAVGPPPSTAVVHYSPEHIAVPISSPTQPSNPLVQQPPAPENAIVATTSGSLKRQHSDKWSLPQCNTFVPGARLDGQLSPITERGESRLGAPERGTGPRKINPLTIAGSEPASHRDRSLPRSRSDGSRTEANHHPATKGVLLNGTPPKMTTFLHNK